MPRLFVAVDLPDAVEDQLWHLSHGVPGARWVERGDHHLTLRFIGEVGPEMARDVAEALDGVRAAPFQLQLKGVGHFPPRGPAKVLWAGIAPNDELMRLQQKVEKALVGLGLPPEDRKFHPHVTLTRLRDAPHRRVADFLAMAGLFESAPFLVEAFGLYSSVLREEGARHFLEEEYRLVG